MPTDDIPPVPLDADIRALLETMAGADLPKMTSFEPAEIRRRAAQNLSTAPTRPIALVEDRAVAGAEGSLRCRLYHPAPGQLRPLLVYFHGGGWVLGSIEGADPTCRRIVDEADVAILSVDYRLAPEHPYPAPVEDARAATRYVLAHPGRFGADPSRIGVGGSSAGGHLAAVVAQTMRDEGARLHLQYLIYPVTDCDFERPSMRANATGRGLETHEMKWFWNHFCPDLDRRLEWGASPVRRDDLTGLAPAVISLAGHDPLFSEGLAYARRLEAAGVPTETRIAPDLIHAFFELDAASPRADAEIGRLNREVGIRMHTPAPSE